MTLLINLLGLLLIAAIVWWFWLAAKVRDDGQKDVPAVAAVAGQPIEVIVRNGVYEPDQLRVPAGQSVTLHFLREDPSPCAEYVLFPDLEVSAQLPVNVSRAIQLPVLQPGNYPFHCQMQMYRGVLTVE